MSTERSANQSPNLEWFKSSYSGTSGGDCVEVAACPGTVHVRDSRDKAGPTLAFTPAEWHAFVAFAARQPVPAP